MSDSKMSAEIPSVSRQEVENFLVEYHEQVWEAAQIEEGPRTAYDQAGRQIAKEFLSKFDVSSPAMTAADVEQLKADLITFKGGVSALGAACKKLTFCARTVTDGPDKALMAACDAAEAALSLGGVSRAIDYVEGLEAENARLRAACEGAVKYVAFAFDQGIEGADSAGLALEAASLKVKP
ncbi:MAG: hypothetical protein EOO81_09260 [Oxalobacteraceae bacterium]|nr:MAG: hypothetical protein EOO81_09260 [Oxalobacteraceae bacterium]